MTRRPPANRAEYADALRALVHSPPWCLEWVDVSDDRIQVRGWAIAPQGRESAVWINGAPFEHPVYGVVRDDIAGVFWYLDGANVSGFLCQTPRASADGVELAFGFVDPATGRPFDANNDYFFHLGEAATPQPPAPLRKRVHGSEDLVAFLVEGCSNYRKLERALLSVMGRKFRDFQHVLDWGCGCGRLARYFVRGARIAYTGVDIDSENVAWCRENLRRGGLSSAQFTSGPLEPPMPLSSSTFDLVIGISVLTHLGERDQFEWLEELSRVCLPGAVLLLTVLGDASVCRAGLPIEHFSSLCEHGYVDAGRNGDLDGVIAQTEYYRNVFHTHDYITAHWSRFFDIVRIVPGYIGNHQDLVVLVKRRL